MSSPIPQQQFSSPESLEVARLIRNFLQSERSEEAFAEIVRSLGGLVYSSALRRAGNSSLAEEISQNVFALLARKARALANHPAPLAWVFQTTKFEAAKAMRSEMRHQRKQAALAREQLGTLSSANEADGESWRDALPHLDASLDQLAPRERELVLQRYVQQRKFREIAASTGQSEAACKMRVRRALDRLARLLTSRGVALSTTALGSLLASELSKAAPASLLLSSGKMLAAGKSLTTATLLTNAIQTMSATKSVTITAAAVILLTAGPSTWQHAQAKALAGEVERLERKQAGLSGVAKSPRQPDTARGSVARPGPRTVRAMLAASNNTLDAEAFMYELMEVVTGQDTLGMLRLFLSLSKMSEEDVSALITAIEGQPAPQAVKQNALRMLADFTPAANPRETMERTLKLGLDPQTIAGQLAEWGAKDPLAALAWFRESSAIGLLSGKGLDESPEGILYAQLIEGIARKDTALAISLFAKASLDEQSMAARGLAEALLRDGEVEMFPERIAELMGLARDGTVTDRIAKDAALTLQRKTGTDAALALLDQFNSNQNDRAGILADLAANHGFQRNSPISERAEWLLRHASPEQVESAVKSFVRQLTWQGTAGLDEWIESQPAGATRDTAWSSRAVTHNNHGRHQAGLEAALRVENAVRMQETLQQVAQFWKHRDAPGAAKAFEAAGLDPAAYHLTQP